MFWWVKCSKNHRQGHSLPHQRPRVTPFPLVNIRSAIGTYLKCAKQPFLTRNNYLYKMVALKTSNSALLGQMKSCRSKVKTANIRNISVNSRNLAYLKTEQLFHVPRLSKARYENLKSCALIPKLITKYVVYLSFMLNYWMKISQLGNRSTNKRT